MILNKQVKSLPDLDFEEFAKEANSVFVRLTYEPSISGYKVIVFNNMDLDKVNEDQVKMVILARGLAELCIESTNEVFQVGYAVSLKDAVDLSNLTETEKLLLNNPIGNA